MVHDIFKILNNKHFLFCKNITVFKNSRTCLNALLVFFLESYFRFNKKKKT